MTTAPSAKTQFRPGDVVVANLARARRIKRRFDAVITLEDPTCRTSNQLRFHKLPSPAHLILAFEDVDDDNVGIRVATRAEVASALNFARMNSSGSLLIHCYHGVGRSAAIALGILADRAGAGDEAAALKQLLALRPEATPNLVVVKLADDILQRNGSLIAALAEWEAEAPSLREKREARRAFLRSHPHLYSLA